MKTYTEKPIRSSPIKMTKNLDFVFPTHEWHVIFWRLSLFLDNNFMTQIWFEIFQTEYLELFVVMSPDVKNLLNVFLLYNYSCERIFCS